MQELQSKLFATLGTPVSKVILDQLTDKQFNYIWHKCDIVKSGRVMNEKNNCDMWNDDIETSIEEIKNVLDFGKSKLKKHYVSDSTKAYIDMKLNNK